MLFTVSVYAQTDTVKSYSDSTKSYEQLEEIRLMDKKLDPYTLLGKYIENNLTYKPDADTTISYKFYYLITGGLNSDTLATAEGTFVIKHQDKKKDLNRNVLDNLSAITHINYWEKGDGSYLKTNYSPEMSIGRLIYSFNFITDDYPHWVEFRLRKLNHRKLEFNKDIVTEQYVFNYYGREIDSVGSLKLFFNKNRILDSVVCYDHLRLVNRSKRNISSKLLMSYDIKSTLLYPAFIDYSYQYATIDKNSSLTVRVIAMVVDTTDANQQFNAEIYQKRISILLPIQKAYEFSLKKKSYYD